MKIQTLILMGLAVAAVLFFTCQKEKANQLSKQYLEELTKNAQLTVEMAGVQSKLVGAIATEQDLKSQLAMSNKKLASLIKDRGEKLTEIDRLKLSFDSLSAQYATTPKIDSTGGCIVGIDTTLGKLKLDGWTRCDSLGAFVSLKAEISPIRLQLFKTKKAKDLMRYYVQVAPEDSSFLSVDSLEVMFKPDKPSFWQKNALYIGIVGGIATYFLLK